MNVISTAIWTVVQIFILLISLWFLIYGIRNIFDRKGFAVIFIVLALLGIWGVFNSIYNIFGGI
ncbi:MAG TPA: hypothetical protein VFF20_08290 [Pseudogracilibacillus sp.]|nr:hypothetical protein [Pseudogracilibacillus sp.]